MNSGFFQNMAPNAQRSFIVTVLIAAVAAAIFMFALQPARAALEKARREHAQLEDQKRLMDVDLKEADRVKSRLEQLDAEMKPVLEAMLTPLLESWAMRAKSKLDLYASEAGLVNVEYSELPVRALPVPKPMPRQLYARRPIKVGCRGTFAAVASFVLRVEKELPYVTVTGLQISSQAEPDSQKAEIVLEWPVNGAVTTPAAAAAGKGAAKGAKGGAKK